MKEHYKHTIATIADNFNSNNKMWGRLASEAKFTKLWLREFYIKDCFRPDELLTQRDCTPT